MTSEPERPITHAKQDSLDRGRFVERLVSALINPAGQSTGVVLGLTGQWGSGKSSILNLLDDEIRRQYRNAFVVRFDPWLVSDRDDLVAEFFEEIMATIASEGDRSAKATKELVGQLARYARVLSPAAVVANPLAAPILSALGHALDEWVGRKETITEVRDKVKEKLAALHAPVVVLVDEVDRVEDNEIRSIAQFVRSVADFRGISYLLAYDSHRVIQALGSGASPEEREERGRHYLEKIVQLPISLPILFTNELENLLEAELAALSDLDLPKTFQNLPRYKTLTERLVLNVIATPRDIKRVVGTFNVLWSMVRREVDWIDLLGFAVITTKYPRTLRLIREDAEAYVDNPLGLAAQMKRMTVDDKKSVAEKIQGAIHKGEDNPDLRWLIGLLFPTFGDGRSRRDEYPDPISNRRSLLTVLRLGLVPGAASRYVVDKLTSMTAEEVAASLNEAMTTDQLASLVDRLDDIYPDSEIHHVHFWRGVAHFLTRRSDAGPEQIVPMRSIQDNFERLLVSATVRKPALKNAAREVFHDLAERGDLTLVPAWLRDQMWAHGLYSLKERGDHNAWFDAKESTFWAERLATNWKQRFLNENLILKVWDLHFAYAILQSNNWDEVCRVRLSQLMLDDETFDSIIVLMFGGIMVTQQTGIAELCDAELFWKRVDERLASAGINERPAVFQALTKAKAREY